MSLQLQTDRSSFLNPPLPPVLPPELARPSALAGAHVLLPQLAFNPGVASLLDGGAKAPVPNFDAQVRGPVAKPVDLQLALISQDVYDPTSKGIPGWTRLTGDQLTQAGIDPASLEDPSTGFRAAIYQDKNGDHVLAFAGSNDGKDWLNNFEQGLGLPAVEYS